jgi:hypothetical protein
MMGATLERTIIVYGISPRPEFYRFECRHCPGRVETAPLGAVDMTHKCNDGTTRYLRGVK